MQQRIFDIRCEQDATFSKCFEIDITQSFFDELELRDNVCIWIYGITGSGKSAVAQELAKKSDKGTFSAKRIKFTNQDIKIAVENSKEGNSFIRDETAKDFGEGSGALLSTIQDIVETLRKRRNSFYLLSPVIKGQGFVHYYIEVLQANVSLDEVSVKKFIHDGGKELIFRCGIQDQYNNNLGFIIIKSKVNNPVWLEYCKEKDNFLDQMAKGERKTGINPTIEAEKFIKLIDLQEYPQKTHRLTFIKSNSNYTTAQAKTIHSEYERLLNKQKEVLKPRKWLSK